jgi:hypothetical protein
MQHQHGAWRCVAVSTRVLVTVCVIFPVRQQRCLPLLVLGC